MAQNPPTFPFAASTILNTRPNTIELKVQGWREESVNGDTENINPGMLIEKMADSKVKRHATAGGKSQKMFAKEDAYRGKTIIDGLIPTDFVPYTIGLPGDRFLALLDASAVAVTEGDDLISAGDGTLMKTSQQGAHTLYSNTAASAAVTNTATETAFDKSYTILANTLKAGDVVTIKGQGIATATHTTDTLTIKVKIGTTVILTIPATDVADNDIFDFEITLVIRTVGASGTFVADCDFAIGAAGTAAPKAHFKASTAVDTTSTQAITVTATWSAADVGNSVRLDVLDIESARISPQEIVAKALESIDNSAGTTMAFIRVELV